MCSHSPRTGQSVVVGWLLLDWSVYFYPLLFYLRWSTPPRHILGAKCIRKHWLSQGNCGGDGCWLHYLALQVKGISTNGGWDGLGLWEFLHYQWQPMFTHPLGTREDHRVSRPSGPNVWAVQTNRIPQCQHLFCSLVIFPKLESNGTHTHTYTDTI